GGGRGGARETGPAKTARRDADPSFPPVEVLNLDLALWGVDLPNTVKGITVGWDGARLWVGGIATQRIAAIDPAKGHPVASVDLDVRGHSPALLRADPKRRRIYWVSRQDGSIRAVDLDRDALLASVDGERPERANAFPIQDAAVDPDTGVLWVANRRAGTVTGYDGALAVVATLTDAPAPSALAVRDGTLAILDSPGREGERILLRDLKAGATRELAVPGATGPVTLAWGPDGALVVVGRAIVALGQDGATRWRAEAPAVPDRAVVAGDALAVVFEKASRDAPPAESLLVLWDLATGRERGRVPVSYEAKFLDTDGARVFVGNGGDGSVSVVDARTATKSARWDAGNAAEQVVIDPKTGTRYVLDRLGGSTIYVWPRGSRTVTPWELGGWPTEMALEGTDLWVLGHHAAELVRVDAREGDRLGTIALGVPGNRTDTLGDLDVAGGLAAVSFPETGSLVLVDLAKGRPRWTKTPEWLRAGEKSGPGEGAVKLDPKRDRLYVATRTTVRALSLRDGAELGELALPDRPKGYEVNPLWLDGDRLFVGPDVVKVPSLALEARVELAMKVFWSQEDALLGLQPGRGSDPELLVELDPVTLQARRTFPLVPTGMMRLNATYDPASKRVYATDMAEARVFAWAWP
ncbi:MAG: YncE family protein, partial [Myxococcota bacterium]